MRSPFDLIPVAGPDDGPYALTTGPDAAAWVTSAHSGEIARISPPGSVTRFALDTPECAPSTIASGLDGARRMGLETGPAARLTEWQAGPRP